MNKQIPLLLSASIICTISIAMDDEPFDKISQSISIEDKIKPVITKKAIGDLTYTTLIVGMTAFNIYNVISEEPALHSDYFGAELLSIGNKIDTALALGLGLADIAWLLKPYCIYPHDASHIESWANGMMITHYITGNVRSAVAGLVGICGGIRRYPRTLTLLTANALLDFAGFINAENHSSVAKEIEDLQNKPL